MFLVMMYKNRIRAYAEAGFSSLSPREGGSKNGFLRKSYEFKKQANGYVYKFDQAAF